MIVPAADVLAVGVLGTNIFRRARSQNCEKSLLALSCQSVRMKQLCSHWTDFHEVWYLRIFFFFFENLCNRFNLHYHLT
jgi:hypothetical protein